MTAFQEFVTTLPEWLQWFGVVAVSAVPFIESYFGSAIGVFAGIPAPVAVIAAVVGNAVSMTLIVLAAHRTRQSVLDRRAGDATETPDPDSRKARRQAKVKRIFDKWGVPGVSLLGQTFLPSQITSGMLVGFGASHKAVIGWQIVSIVMWGAVFASLASLGLIGLA